MTLTESPAASVTMDDPDFNLRIRTSGDYKGWRSAAVFKEPWTFDWLKTIGSGTFYDVGACVGSYSLIAASRGATVIAIEPVPVNYAECVVNACLNGLCDKITVLQCAAGESSGSTLLFASPSPGYGQASRDHRYDGQKLHIRVSMRTLADIAAGYGPPTHIKIDVEGAEREVISGARDILAGVESVICEIRDDYNERWILRVMQGHGFKSVWQGGRRTEDERTHIFRRTA